jgi:hypothetical protein
MYSGGVDCADIALIALEDAPETMTPRVDAITAATGGDGLLLITQSGPVKGWVRAVSPSWLLSPQVGSWGQVIITDKHYTGPGDSGAPVFLDDGSERLVGHVVAGAANYTLVQDADYQLQALGLTLRTP